MTKPPTSESSAAAGAVLPCPWCQGPYVKKVGRCIECIGCGASGPEMSREANEAEYIHVWNSRSTPQPTSVSEKSPEAGSVGVPEGWQLVPKEPTEAMMAAAWNHTPLEMDDMTDGYFGQAYRDMLAAAPAPKEDCFCDRTGLGVRGVSCGDCPKDYKPKETP